MNINIIKKKIEENRNASAKLLNQVDKERNKKSIFKNNKKIGKLEQQMSELDKELVELENALNNEFELQESKRIQREKRASFVKKNGPIAGIGVVAASAAYCGYLSFKPLNIDGEQMTYRAKISSFENVEVSSADYTPATYERYMHNLEDAEAQKNDIFMSDEEKLEYIEAVSSAYEALEPIPDKTELLTLINDAERYDLLPYTPNSVKDFKSVITKTKAVYDDSNATEKEVADAEKKITAAYQKLIAKADKTGLEELVTKYTDFALDDYTPSSVKNFNQEIQDSKILIDDENISQTKVDEQIKEMQSIENLLVKKADKTSLQSLISECNGLNGENYKTGYEELVSEVESVETILNNEEASQEEVDSAVSRLQTARSSLVEYTTYVYRVNMRASMQYNDHVGNDWVYDRYYNGGYVHDGTEVSGAPGTYAEVGMQITESDNSPDVGYGGTAIYLQDGYQTSFDVTVFENRGRYSGNAASFTVNVTVTFLRRE